MECKTVMRFDTKAIFIKKEKERYNPKIGGMEAKEIRDTKYCSYRNVGLKEQNELFSKVDVGAISLVVKGKSPDYEFVEIKNKRYKVLAKEEFRQKTGYIVGGV